MREIELKRVEAIHEAGHAAIALRFNIPVVKVTLDPPHLRRALYRMTPLRLGAWRLAIMCMGGPSGEQLICGTHGGGRIDEQMAADYLGRCFPEEEIDALLERAYRSAQRLVEASRPEIEIIARGLLAHGTLDADQLRRVASCP